MKHFVRNTILCPTLVNPLSMAPVSQGLLGKKEVILFENPFSLLTLLLRDVNNFNEKCTREVLCASPGKPQTSLDATDPLSG